MLRPMNPAALTAQLVPQQPVPAAVLAARAGLEALTARLGQTLEATVGTTNAQGLTQLRVGGETLTVRLSQPLPPGTQIEVKVQLSSTGVPVLAVQPRTAHAPAPLPAGAPPLPPVTPLGLPPGVAASPAAVSAGPGATVLGAATATAVLPSVAVAGPVAPAAAPAATVAGIQPPAGTPVAMQAPATPPPTAAPPLASGATQAAPTAGNGMVTAIPTQAATPSLAQPPSVHSPSPAGAPPAGAPPSAAGPATPVAAAVANAAPPGSATPAVSGAAMPLPTAPAAPSSTASPVPGAGPITSQVPGAPTASVATTQVLAAPPGTGPVSAAGTPPPAPGAAILRAPVAPASAPPTPSGAPAAPALPASAAAQPTLAPAASRAAPPPPATNGPAPAIAAVATPAPLARLSLSQPAQAAARQDSIAPLLQNLGAMQGKLASLPSPVAEAATRLLGARLPLDKGAPSAAVLRNAIARSGVFLEAPVKAGAPAQADVRSALLQLRAGLLGLIGDGAEIAPVAPITRRPPPPMRDAQPRGMRAEMPSLPDGATPREAARTLLSQTDGALARLKLAQVASQPQDAGRALALPTSDFIVELPMMLGHELAMAQLQVQRDGQGKDRRGERGWRVRFAVSFSVIGEVGAQISLLGKAASVALWAAEEETARALEEMLPELAPALEAKGIEPGALRVRRGPPADEKPAAAGRLMDRVG